MINVNGNISSNFFKKEKISDLLKVWGTRVLTTVSYKKWLIIGMFVI